MIEARLETRRVMRVKFDNGHEVALPVSSLPFSTGPLADEVQLLADGDLVSVLAPSEPFDVTADELWGLATDSLGNPSLAATVGGNLRAIRKELGLSLGDAAALTGIAPPNLHTLESGSTSPRLDTLEKLARAYHVPVASLVIERPAEEGGRR